MEGQFQRGKLSLAVILVGATLASAVQAQTPALEEVIVTAQKRSESLQDIPVSISAFNAESIEAMQLHTAKDVGLASPSLQTPTYPTTANNLALFIRGIGNADSIVLTKDPTVGIYYDGVYAARSSGLLADLADLERVEILRGPQGTLYGRNTTAGAVNFINAKPTGELGFKQTLSFGNYSSFRSTSHLNLPETAGFSAKVTAAFTERDGWVENEGANATPGQPYKDFYEEDNDGYRVALRYAGIEKLLMDYSYDYSDMSTAPGYFQYGGPLGFDPTTFNTITASFDDRLEETRSPVTGEDTAYYLPNTDTEVQGHNLTISYDINDKLSIKSITGYRDLDDDASMNFAQSFGGGSPFEVNTKTDQDQFSQELQLIGTEEQVKWVAGLYYFDEDGDQTERQYLDRELYETTGIIALDFTNFPPTPCSDGSTSAPVCNDFAAFFPVYLGEYKVKTNVESWAAFGQATWTPEILDNRLDLTLGLRYTDDDRDATRTNDGLLWNSFGPGASDSDLDEVDYTAVADYSWTENISTYFKVSTGFRSGGSSRNGLDFNTPFNDESLTSYELGWKTELWDNRLRVNGAIFHMEVDDIILDFLPDPVNNPQFVEVFNSGDADIDGLELDVTAAITDHFLVSFSYAYLDYSINNAIFPDGSDRSDSTELLWAPENAFAVSADYDVPLDIGSLRFHMDYSWQDDQYALANTDPEEVQVDAFGLANIELFGGNWQVAAWGRNLTDEDDVNYKIGTTAATYIPPRMYGGEIIFEF
jgi:iron complex outermembrane receptor protein